MFDAGCGRVVGLLLWRRVCAVPVTLLVALRLLVGGHVGCGSRPHSRLRPVCAVAVTLLVAVHLRVGDHVGWSSGLRGVGMR